MDLKPVGTKLHLCFVKKTKTIADLAQPDERLKPNQKGRITVFAFCIDFLTSLRQYRHFKSLPSDLRSIVVYSESGQDWHHFEPIVHYLVTELKKNVCYVTSDKNDGGLLFHHPLLKQFYIKPGYLQIVFFQFLKADILLLTMIDLDVFHLKRSIYPVHYIYLFHAMGSTHMVDFENSYDAYDTILCVGPHQIKEIRSREKLKNLKPKNCIEHGYHRLEKLIELEKNYKKPSTVNAPATILIAPTWTENSILPICGMRLVEILLDLGYNVILRPHYQTVRLHPEIIIPIIERFKANKRFSYVDKMGDISSLLASDLLICDWSSMSIEYGLGLAKPVLYIDVPPRIRNPHYTMLECEPMEFTIRNHLGIVLKPTDIDTIGETIVHLLNETSHRKKTIEELRHSIVFNLGSSVPVAASHIVEITQKIALQRTTAHQNTGTKNLVGKR